MLHCGDPIQYTSIDTSYWQAHFYAFGRLSYNVDLVRPYFVSLYSSSSWDREWSNIYEVYVTDSDGSSINFSMNRDMAVITICQYDYSDSNGGHIHLFLLLIIILYLLLLCLFDNITQRVSLI